MILFFRLAVPCCFIFLLSLITVAPISAQSGASSMPRYAVVDLGKVEITGGGAIDINEHGQVALNLVGNGYIWDDGVLSPPGGVPNNNSAFAINDSGHLTWISGGVGRYYDGVSITTLPRLEAWGSLYSHDLNNHDVVVGVGRRDGSNRAFRWDGTMSELEQLSPDGGSRAHAINDAGVIVGSAHWNDVPVRWVNGQIELLPMAATMSRGSALDISESGWIVGHTRNPGIVYDIHATVWQGNEVSILGPLGHLQNSVGVGVNDSGDVVGYAKSTASGTERAFLYHESEMLDLNELVGDPEWIFQYAYSINNAGQIVGVGKKGSDKHAFLLTPVPEPTSIAMFGIAMLGMARRRRKA